MTIEAALALLSAGLEGDERIARAADDLQEDSGWGIVTYAGTPGFTITPHIGHIHETEAAEHAVRFGPDRSLRQVEAIRKVIADVEPRVPHFDAHIADGDQTFASYTEGYRDACVMFLSALAGIYPEPTEETEAS